jgi:DNA-directed RNA polymerase subunit K/omega
MTTHEEPIETKIDFQLNIDEPDDDMAEIDAKNMFATSVVSHKETMDELNKAIPTNNQYPFLLANEEAKIIGLRAQQLANGAPALVDTTGMTCVIKIAKKELKEGVNPFVIRRTFPDDTFVDLRVNELRR